MAARSSNDKQHDFVGPQPGPNLSQTPILQNPGESYFEIPVRNLKIDGVLDFDLFKKLSFARYMIVQSRGKAFTEELRDDLTNSKIYSVFIPTNQRSVFNRYTENHLDHILDDPKTPHTKKSEILYKSASKLVKDIFDDPTSPENVQRSKMMVRNTVTHILKGQACLASMMRIMAYDYETYTHCMNVCVFGTALGKRLGLSAPELNTLGSALLLHDIGKSEIDPAILKKEGPLNDDEWEIMKTHPTKGMEILKNTRHFDNTVLKAVWQHHEKCSGKGYPRGLKESDIHFYSKIVTLADVFDALTTVRPYKNAIESFPAFKIMQQEMKGSFNIELLRELIILMTRGEQLAPARGQEGEQEGEQSSRQNDPQDDRSDTAAA